METEQFILLLIFLLLAWPFIKVSLYFDNIADKIKQILKEEQKKEKEKKESHNYFERKKND